MSTPGYTFVSVSTARPGRLDDLIELARRPSELMDGHVEGLLGRQVSVDRDRNTVIVWTTVERKSDLYDWLETDQGKDDHGEEQDMGAVSRLSKYTTSNRCRGASNCPLSQGWKEQRSCR